MFDTTTSLQSRAKGGVMVSSKQRDGRSVIDGLALSGQCQRKLACAKQGGFVASNHDKTRPIQVLQDVS